MKKRYFYLAALFCPSLLFGQATFNLRHSFEFPAAVLTSVVVTDSCYYSTGIIADSIFPYNTGNIFVKLDLEGNPLVIKTIRSTTKTYETWFEGLAQLPDGSFFLHGYSYDSIMTSILIKYNSEGDTVFIREFMNPLNQNAFIQPRGGLVQTENGGTISSNWITNIPNAATNSDIYLIKTDSLGNKEWGKVFGSSMWDRPQSLLVTPDGKIITGAIRTNDNTNTQNYTYRTHIFQVDSLGNMEWDYLSPLSEGLRDAANDMVLLEDGSLVVATGLGTEYDRPSVNVVYFDKLLKKLNPDHSTAWEKSFVGDRPYSTTFMTNVFQLTDGSGFVAAGMTPTPDDNPNDEKYGQSGWIGKVSPEGDSLWAREYTILDSDIYTHTIYDLKETPDGGFILCGEALDDTFEEDIPQQAWLLKLDQYGCLVPGCHLVDATQEKPLDIRLAIYPNPASDYLNFYLHANRPMKDVLFRVVNTEGRTIESFQCINPNATFILPIWDWEVGVYFLQCIEDGRVIHSEIFIKQ